MSHGHVEILAVKRCRICGEAKPLTEFYRANKDADGHRSECKPAREDDEYYVTHRDADRE